MKKKKILSVLLTAFLLLSAMPAYSLAAEGEVDVNAENFPDEVFRSYVSENIDKDQNGSLSQDGINLVFFLNVGKKGISDLTGIEYFTKLISLNCNNNNITSLDLSKNTALLGLLCQYNKLTELDLSQNPKMEAVTANDNEIENIKFNENAPIENIELMNNKLTSLVIVNPDKLEFLSLDSNNL